MAFPNIDVSKPLGSYRVSTIDDYERETRRWLRDCMMEISGYPDSSTIKISTWTTATRPQNPVAGLFGFNTTTNQFEYYDGTTWKNLSMALPDIYDKARRDANGNVIHETYLTNEDLQAVRNLVDQAIEDLEAAMANINVTKLKIW